MALYDIQDHNHNLEVVKKREWVTDDSMQTIVKECGSSECDYKTWTNHKAKPTLGEFCD